MFATRTIAAVRVSAVALFTLIAAPVVVQPVGASYIASTTVSASNVETVTFTFNGTSETAYAGAFQTVLANSNGTAASSTLNTYCVDITDELQAKQTVNLGSISNLAGGNGAYVGSLYANFAASATSAVQKAALQLAIWKTEYDGANASSNTGHFVVTSASQDVINQAVTYYTTNKLVSNDVAYLQVASGTAGQSLVGPSLATVLTPANTAVPEPASLMMLGMGMVVAIGSAARRARRSNLG